jgi:short-subunit dehydrogenase
MGDPLPWKVAWITGASSGIGREVAVQLAARGVKVAASARSADKLQSLGQNVRAFPVDVTDEQAMRTCADNIESILGPIDLAIFAAGTYRPVSIQAIDPSEFRCMVSTNYLGVVNGLSALANRMLARKKGQLGWVASVAGYNGLPKAAAYGPTKAALINLAESIYPEFRQAGVKVSVINPGFVRTPLTAQNDFPMPFLMNADEAARRTIAGLEAGRFEIAFPRRFVAILKLARLLPYPLYFRLIDKFVLK